ncbi:MAG: GNAT family N-acetyltransferase [Bacteroides sp.]|nr:GNAT family N-acetyltransferase [Bacteroides sp.]
MRQRVYLRALNPDDYQTSYKWRNDPEIQKMVGGHSHFVSIETERQWVQNVMNSKDKIVLAICLCENDKYIGNAMLQEIDWINRTAHAPVMIGDKTEWHKGYAMEARMLMLKFAFEERNLRRIFAYILESNLPSIKLQERCGFKKEGVLRESVYKNGRYHNQVIMGLLKHEFYEAYNKYLEKYSTKSPI